MKSQRIYTIIGIKAGVTGSSVYCHYLNGAYASQMCKALNEEAIRDGSAIRFEIHEAYLHTELV